MSSFTKHFTHLKSGDTANDRIALLTTILAVAINLGLTKMAESWPGTSYAKLSWLQARHIRDETYATALAELVNAQFRQPFAENWGDGTTSSSDGQRFKAGGKAESTGHINPKYGVEPGKLFYTHISDQYAPFSSKVVNVGVTCWRTIILNDSTGEDLWGIATIRAQLNVNHPNIIINKQNKIHPAKTGLRSTLTKKLCR